MKIFPKRQKTVVSTKAWIKDQSMYLLQDQTIDKRLNSLARNVFSILLPALKKTQKYNFTSNYSNCTV